MIVILCFLTFTFTGLIEYYYGVVHTFGMYVAPRLLECLFAFQSRRFASVYSILIILSSVILKLGLRSGLFFPLFGLAEPDVAFGSVRFGSSVLRVTPLPDNSGKDTRIHIIYYICKGPQYSSYVCNTQSCPQGTVF